MSVYLRSGHSYTCLPPMILHFLESRFKVAPTATSILMVYSARGNTPSGLPFSAVELRSRGVYTIENGAAIHPVEKVIRVLTKSNDVQNVSASQTATKLQSLGLQANLDMQTNSTQHKIGQRMHRTPCFTPSCPEISNALSGAVSIISTNISHTYGPGSRLSTQRQVCGDPFYLVISSNHNHGANRHRKSA